MAAKKQDKAEEVAADEPKAPKLNDAGWRDPKSVYADDDNSIDARMSRLTKELRG